MRAPRRAANPLGAGVSAKHRCQTQGQKMSKFGIDDDELMFNAILGELRDALKKLASALPSAGSRGLCKRGNGWEAYIESFSHVCPTPGEALLALAERVAPLYSTDELKTAVEQVRRLCGSAMYTFTEEPTMTESSPPDVFCSLCPEKAVVCSCHGSHPSFVDGWDAYAWSQWLLKGARKRLEKEAPDLPSKKVLDLLERLVVASEKNADYARKMLEIVERFAPPSEAPKGSKNRQ